jgi:glycosyltransferase involved in cell wall biosynthesis
MLSDAYENAGEFDLIHSHVDFWDFPLRRLCPVPSVSTLHGRLDLPRMTGLYENYSDLPLISISDSQREPLHNMNWIATVYHGLPEDIFQFNPSPDRYLAFLGRFAPEKGFEWAVQIANGAGIPLKVAAKVDEGSKEYFKEVVEPLLSTPGVEYLGEVSGAAKASFLGNALALLFPIDWPEPFGLVMIEAMACGTPVITRPFGSVPEIVRDGVNGRVASDVDELIRGAEQIHQISRHRCRREFEDRFTLDRMVSAYEKIYNDLIRQS